jgi:hypothetical protein
MAEAAAASPRYAVYFVPAPASALYRFGAALLGYDCYSGNDVAFPDALPTERAAWHDLTAEPRRYGFHATLKAPFRLAPQFREAELVEQFQKFTNAIEVAPSFAPAIDVLQGFIAIVPAAADPVLGQLAASCVTGFDRFRAPLSAQDRARRLAGLSARQLANLDRWGYPFVFDDFRLHMTLTGRLAAERQAAVLSYLRKEFTAGCGAAPLLVDRLALLRQDRPETRFLVISQAAIGAGR